MPGSRLVFVLSHAAGRLWDSRELREYEIQYGCELCALPLDSYVGNRFFSFMATSLFLLGLIRAAFKVSWRLKRRDGDLYLIVFECRMVYKS